MKKKDGMKYVIPTHSVKLKLVCTVDIIILLTTLGIALSLSLRRIKEGVLFALRYFVIK